MLSIANTLAKHPEILKPLTRLLKETDEEDVDLAKLLKPMLRLSDPDSGYTTQDFSGIALDVVLDDFDL